MKKIIGKTLFEGIIVKKCVVISTKLHKFKKSSTPSLDCKKEYEKYQKIKDQIICDIKNIKKNLVNVISKEDLEIFDAQIQMIDDPSFSDRIKDKIYNKKYRLPYASSVVAKKIIEEFKKIHNDYFKARINDIQEINEMIINYYFDVNASPSDWADKIIVKNELSTTDVANIKALKAAGIIVQSETSQSHAMILAQQLSIPILIDCKGAVNKIQSNEKIILDTEKSMVLYNKISNETYEKYNFIVEGFLKQQEEIKKYSNVKTLTKDGNHYRLAVNINNLDDMKYIQSSRNAGIGLLRTEFIFSSNSEWPSEELQYKEYLSVANACENRTATIRTLDIGNDKTLPYYSMEQNFSKEDNPVLGVRGIRFSKKRPDIFKTQIKAILRANAKYENLKIMLPMVVELSEILWAKRIIKLCESELSFENKKYSANIKLGIMIETPSAVFNAKLFSKHVDFFSIGTNDLMQYIFCTDRLNSNVSYLWEPLNPGFLNALISTITVAKKAGIPCSMCGSLAGNKLMLPLLIGMGLDVYSVNLNLVSSTRYIINSLSTFECKKILSKVLKLEHPKKMYNYLDDYIYNNIK